jgi:hypothetical protein
MCVRAVTVYNAYMHIFVKRDRECKVYTYSSVTIATDRKIKYTHIHLSL